MQRRDPQLRWLLLGNCQVFGLANCLRVLSPGLAVEAWDLASYQRDGDALDARLSDFDRILVMDQASDLLPMAEDERIARLPGLYFSGYHPDLCYLAQDGPLSRGPLGHYHSAIAYAGFALGFDVARTLGFFNRETYERLGYFDAWTPARNLLLDAFARDGFDLRLRFVDWVRKGPFMHTINHPRIDVLLDVARMLLEQAGVAHADPGFVPEDNLVKSAVFPVYPELASSLGVGGTYRFKPGGEYRVMGLDEFVAASFDAYRDAGDVRPTHPAFRDRIEYVVDRLGGAEGRPRRTTRHYRDLFQDEMARRGDFPRCFAFGLHGSGSSLLHSMVHRTCTASGIPAINIPDRMVLQGLRDAWPGNRETLDLIDDGRVHYGFRQLPVIFKDPVAKVRDSRAVLLVRDPRDALVSRYFATGGRLAPPFPTIEGGNGAGQDGQVLDIDAFVLFKAGELRERMLDYRAFLDFDAVLLRRYEDVRHDGRAFIEEVFDHFGLQVRRAVLDRVAAAHRLPRRQDMQRAKGNHRLALRAETIARLDEIFDGVAELYGYDLDARTLAMED